MTLTTPSPETIQIECQNYACEHGVDKPEIDHWTWPA